MHAASTEMSGRLVKCGKAVISAVSIAQSLPKIYQQIEEWALTAHQANRVPRRQQVGFQMGRGRDPHSERNRHAARPLRDCLMPVLAAPAGLNFGELVKWMVEDASLDR